MRFAHLLEQPRDGIEDRHEHAHHAHADLRDAIGIGERDQLRHEIADENDQREDEQRRGPERHVAAAATSRRRARQRMISGRLASASARRMALSRRRGFSISLPSAVAKLARRAFSRSMWKGWSEKSAVSIAEKSAELAARTRRTKATSASKAGRHLRCGPDHGASDIQTQLVTHRKREE